MVTSRQFSIQESATLLPPAQGHVYMHGGISAVGTDKLTFGWARVTLLLDSSQDQAPTENSRRSFIQPLSGSSTVTPNSRMQPD